VNLNHLLQLKFLKKSVC